MVDVDADGDETLASAHKRGGGGWARSRRRRHAEVVRPVPVALGSDRRQPEPVHTLTHRSRLDAQAASSATGDTVTLAMTGTPEGATCVGTCGSSGMGQPVDVTPDGLGNNDYCGFSLATAGGLVAISAYGQNGGIVCLCPWLVTASAPFEKLVALHPKSLTLLWGTVAPKPATWRIVAALADASTSSMVAPGDELLSNDHMCLAGSAAASGLRVQSCGSGCPLLPRCAERCSHGVVWLSVRCPGAGCGARCGAGVKPRCGTSWR